MELDEQTNPDPVVETEVADTQPEANDTPDVELEQSDDTQEPEFEEVEVDGKLYKVPKEIAPNLMKGLDYTQKTQSLAEQRRGWEAQAAQEREYIQREAETFEAIKSEVSQRISIESRLDELRQVNINNLSPQDAVRYNNEIMQLQWSHNELSGNIEARRSEIAAQREQNDANAWGQTVTALEKPDERLGWSGKFDQPTQARLAGIARELGVPEHEIKGIRNPVTIKALHLVGIGLETLKKTRAASPGKSTVDAKPVPVVSGGRSKSVVDPEKLSAADWVKHREADLAKRRR